MESVQGTTSAGTPSGEASASEPPPGLASDVAGCAAPTKAVHPETHSGPRLRNFDHLELEHSRLTRGFLAKLGLAALELFDDLRDLKDAIARALWPRRDLVAGRPLDTCAIAGRLTFGQKEADDHVPLHHMHVELWGRKLWGSWVFFGRDTTGCDGRFRIPYDLRLARRWWLRSLRVEMLHTGSHRFVDGEAVEAGTLFDSVEVDRKSLVGLTYDIGTQQLFYWEYRTDTPVPRVVIRDHDEDAPEQYSQGRLDAVERQFVPIELIKEKHMLEIRAHEKAQAALHAARERGPELPGGSPEGPEPLGVLEIQADYPENLTQCIEKRHPGYTRSDKWFGERFMNGMYASDFDRDPEDPERYWVHYHWNSYEQTPGEHAMPDVDVFFRLGEDGLPVPVEIRLTGPLNAFELDERPIRTFTPEDGDRWQQAKRVARVSGALYTEVAHHFTITHLNVEQFSIAAHRNLRLSPLTILLFPHLKEVTLVDSSADRILVGNGYISQATALTARGIDQLALKTLGTLDWQGWEPPEPISDAHTYAQAAGLYWRVISDYVGEFLEAERRGILDYWFEVYRFSEDLVNHSVPTFLCRYLQKALMDSDGKARDPALAEWYRREHRMDLHAERPMVGGVPRSMSRITSHADAADVGPEDWQNLRQAAAYAIFQATFGHTWANSKQYDDIGEVLYACLGLRYGDGPDGVLAPESDLQIAPSPAHSTQMMWWSNMLSRTSYGFVMANEDQDISPRLLAALEAKRAEFASLGLPIDDIQSRINI